MNKYELKGLINEVMSNMAKESLKSKLKKFIIESIEEIKYEEKECLSSEMEEIGKLVKEHNKECCVEKDDKGNYNINGAVPHHFSIRPMSEGIYDVVYFKDATDRTKKQNINLKELKEFIKDKLTNKSLNYVKTAFNKTSKNSEDQIEKGDLPRHNIVTKKEVKDTKNDNKDYNEMTVKDDDLPDKPLRPLDKTKKQSEHPIKGTKPDYKQPKLSKKESKLVIKLKTFKGKAKKKD